MKRLELDPYNEEDWGDLDLYVIYVIGQDANFLSCKKIEGYVGGFPYHKYVIAIKEGENINFDGYANVKDPYPVDEADVDKIINGEEKIGYITNISLVKFDKLQNLCDILDYPVENIKMMGH